ncbi:MAG: DUF1800 domain-containing protein [Cyclobacteriaceae bacterium]|nr:DUF1800 domain-containing protein [Cyclobacteriaceae bacterium]
MPLTPYTGVLGPTRAAHLLRRATFGPTIPLIQQFETLTTANALALLFDDQIPDPELPINPETGQDWLLTGQLGEEVSLRGLNDNLLMWLIGLSCDTSQPVSFSTREKIVYFFHTHFTTKQNKVGNSRTLYFQNELFRQFAFDKNKTEEFSFKSLLKKISVDNAMLRFLDGSQNVKGSPNENYGRELMELYAIGRGLEGSFPADLPQGDYLNYTEQDVQAAARVLSGIKLDETYQTIDIDTNLPRGRVATGSHDNDPKQFSNRYNDTVITPDPTLLQNGQPTNESVIDEISQLIEMITSQQESAIFICRTIYRFYVYHEVTQNIQDTVITEMAATLVANGFKIQPVLEELFASEHFYDAVAMDVNDDKYGAIIKSPLDLVAGIYRAFNINFANHVTDYELFYSQMGGISQRMQKMGQDYYEPFEVAGYTAYHQFPAYNRNWISSNYLANRYDLIRNIFVMMSNQNPEMPSFDAVQFTRDNVDNATGADARLLIMAYVQYLFPVQFNLTFNPAADDNSGITAERLNYFLQAFLYEPQLDADPEGEWTNRWNANYEMDVVEGQLIKLFNSLLQTPEYQLM